MKKKAILIIFIVVSIIPLANAKAIEINNIDIVSYRKSFDPDFGVPDRYEIWLFAETNSSEVVTVQNVPEHGSVDLVYKPGWDYGDARYHWSFLSSPAPNGGDWENRTYYFSSGDASDTHYVAPDLFWPMPTPDVTMTGGVHPTFFWDPVPGADIYRLFIMPLDENGLPDDSQILLNMNNISSGYQYFGDLFTSGEPLAVYIQARQQRYGYDINRSATILKHSAPIPEPATMLLLGSGLIGLAGASRKFKK